MTASDPNPRQEQDSDGEQRPTVAAKVPAWVMDKVEREVAESLLDDGEVLTRADVVRSALAEYYDLDETEVQLGE